MAVQQLLTWLIPAALVLFVVRQLLKNWTKSESVTPSYFEAR